METHAGHRRGGIHRLELRSPRVLADEDRHRVVVLDKLTYAGSLENLPPVDENPKFRLRPGRHRRPRDGPVDSSPSTGPAAVVNFAAESHVDRSIDGPDPFIHTNITGTFELLEASRKYLAELPDAEARSSDSASCTSRPTRSTATLGDEGRFIETTPYAPELSVRRVQGVGRSSRARLRGHLRPSGAGHQLQQQLRPVPVPRKADPADDPERARGQAAADLRRRPSTSATGSTSRITARESDRTRTAAHPGEQLQHRRRGRKDANIEIVDRICETRARASDPRPTNPALAERGEELRRPEDLRRGSPRGTTDVTPWTPKIRKELGWSNRSLRLRQRESPRRCAGTSTPTVVRERAGVGRATGASDSVWPNENRPGLPDR